nr:MerR family transcriptional regulator [Streptomyces sp. CB00455]
MQGSAAAAARRQPESTPAGPVGGGPAPEQIGYRGPTACAAAGITYRQLDYWARTALVEPSVRPAHGSGTQRLYSFRDVVVLKIVKRFLDTGVALQNIRTTVQHLRDRGFEDLERMTLMSDGATVYECTSPDQVVSLLQGGQGVFGIAVGVVWRDVENALSQLHGERVDTGETLVRHNPADELAARRNRAV